MTGIRFSGVPSTPAPLWKAQMPALIATKNGNA
jgi:hypothetical protein